MRLRGRGGSDGECACGREKKQRLQGETESRQKIAEMKVELESASATLARVGDQVHN